jgi:hypothetical protein
MPERVGPIIPRAPGTPADRRACELDRRVDDDLPRRAASSRGDNNATERAIRDLRGPVNLTPRQVLDRDIINLRTHPLAPSATVELMSVMRVNRAR